MFRVQKENGEGPGRLLHCNLLLPIGSLPFSESEQQQTTESDFIQSNEPDTHKIKSNRPKANVTEEILSDLENNQIIDDQNNDSDEQNSDNESVTIEITESSDKEPVNTVPAVSADNEEDTRTIPRRSQRSTKGKMERYGNIVMSQISLPGSDWEHRANFIKSTAEDLIFDKLPSNASEAIVKYVLST